MKSLNWNYRILETALILSCALMCSVALSQTTQVTAIRDEVRTRVGQEYPNLFEFYKDLHGHPELSFHEERSAAHFAEELHKAGF